MSYPPLTYVIVRIFARGFYKAHSGMLLFFFVTIIISFFYIGVLNQTHLTPAEAILHNLSLVLATITSPVMASLVFSSWIVLMIKSWRYAGEQLLLPENQFLYYSSTAASKITQYRSWFVVQVIVCLPVLVYTVFSIVIGIIYGYYTIPAVMLLCTLLLAAFSAWGLVIKVNKAIGVNYDPAFSRFVRRWRKPLFSLFLYQAFDKLTLPLAVTKFFSLTILAGGYYLLGEDHGAITGGIISLGFTTAHVVLIYHSYTFENTQLSFARNFPYHHARIYLNWMLTYLLLTLPETLWLLVTFGPGTGTPLLLFALATGSLFHSLLYLTGADMRKFLYRVFFLFTVLFLAILMKLLWLLVLVNMTLSVVIFYSHYYLQESSTKDID